MRQPLRVPPSMGLVLLLATASAVGCDEETSAPDLRFHTPSATVHTLLDAYGVLDVPQSEIERRMALGRRFHLSDPESRALAFADWDEPADEGLAGYVFGNLVRAKDGLRISITEDVAHVHAEDPEQRFRPVVLREDAVGWRIVLEESVPPVIARELRQAFEERQGTETGPASMREELPRVPAL